MPSRGSAEATAVTRTTLSPCDTSAAPGACLAMRPVSKVSRLPPASSTDTSCFMESSFSVQRRRWCRSRQEGTQRPSETSGAGVGSHAVSPQPQRRVEGCGGDARHWPGRAVTGIPRRCHWKRAVERARCTDLLTNAQLADNVAVADGVAGLQVVQKPTPLAYQHQQTTARCVVLLVGLEMFGQLADPFAENRDLHLGTSGIRIVCPEPGHPLSLLFCCHHPT